MHEHLDLQLQSFRAMDVVVVDDDDDCHAVLSHRETSEENS